MPSCAGPWCCYLRTLFSSDPRRKNRPGLDLALFVTEEWEMQGVMLPPGFAGLHVPSLEPFNSNLRYQGSLAVFSCSIRCSPTTDELIFGTGELGQGQWRVFVDGHP